jgi:hypothetical protein
MPTRSGRSERRRARGAASGDARGGPGSVGTGPRQASSAAAVCERAREAAPTRRLRALRQTPEALDSPSSDAAERSAGEEGRLHAAPRPASGMGTLAVQSDVASPQPAMRCEAHNPADAAGHLGMTASETVMEKSVSKRPRYRHSRVDLPFQNRRRHSAGQQQEEEDSAAGSSRQHRSGARCSLCRVTAFGARCEHGCASKVQQTRMRMAATNKRKNCIASPFACVRRFVADERRELLAMCARPACMLCPPAQNRAVPCSCLTRGACAPADRLLLAYLLALRSFRANQGKTPSRAECEAVALRFTARRGGGARARLRIRCTCSICCVTRCCPR